MDYPKNLPTSMTNIGQSQNQQRSSLATSGLCLVRTVVLLFVLLLVTIGIAQHVIKSKDPRFKVASFSVSAFSLSNSRLSGKFEIELTIVNPSKKADLVIDHVKVRLYYEKFELGSPLVKVERINVKRLGEIKVKAESVAESSGQNPIYEDIGDELSKTGMVKLDLRMSVRTRAKAGFWPSKRKFFSVHCGDLDIKFSSAKDTGKLKGFEKECFVSVK